MTRKAKIMKHTVFCGGNNGDGAIQLKIFSKYEGCTRRHEQLFFACKPGKADEGEYGSRWNKLLC